MKGSYSGSYMRNGIGCPGVTPKNLHKPLTVDWSTLTGGLSCINRETVSRLTPAPSAISLISRFRPSSTCLFKTYCFKCIIGIKPPTRDTNIISDFFNLVKEVSQSVILLLDTYPEKWYYTRVLVSHFALQVLTRKAHHDYLKAQS